jgi:hypothetical protein
MTCRPTAGAFDFTTMTDPPLTTTRRRRFLGGLGNHHPLVLVAAFALVLLALLGLQALFTSGAYTVVPENVLLRTARDDFFHNAYTVGHLKLHHPDRLPIYVIGGSAARESLISDRSFASAVQRASGVPVRAYVLSNYDQSFGQSLAIIDNLPPGPGIVVLAVNNNRFHFSPTSMARQLRGLPLLLSSPTLRQFVARNPKDRLLPRRLPGILPGILDYLVGYYESRGSALAKLRGLRIAYKPHWITQRKAWSLAKKRKGVEQWIRLRGPEFFRFYPYNARLLDTLVARAQQRGFRVVLLEETEDTAVVGSAFDPFKRIYKPIVRRIAVKYGVPYLDLQERLHLPDSAFWDFIHPVEPARVVWQRTLAGALGSIVQSTAAPSPAAGSSGGSPAPSPSASAGSDTAQ